jgi:hypothetical protein
MTTLEYMERQLDKHKATYLREAERKVPEEQLKNIERKITHYEEAIEALKRIMKEAKNGN